MQRGPKALVRALPLDLFGLPDDRAERRIEFIERFLRVPRGHGVGEPFLLRPWQKEIVRSAYAPGVRTALCSIPRGNGKTSLAAALGVAELWAGPPSAEVAVVASNAEQAGLTLSQARRMVENSPALAQRCQVYRDRLAVPENDAVLTALPAEPRALHGLDASLLLADELHVMSRETWEAATTASG